MLLGIASDSVQSVIRATNAGKSADDRGERRKNKRAAAASDMVFLDLLARIDELNDQIAALRGNIKALDKKLRDEFGDDYLEDMAQMYLDDREMESLAGLSPQKREERIRALLSNKMLNNDGSVKAGYEHLDIALLLAALREESDLQQRLDKLDEARASGDREAARKALGDDALSDTLTHESYTELQDRFAESVNGQDAEVREAEKAQPTQSEENQDVANTTCFNVHTFG